MINKMNWKILYHTSTVMQSLCCDTATYNVDFVVVGLVFLQLQNCTEKQNNVKR